MEKISQQNDQNIERNMILWLLMMHSYTEYAMFEYDVINTNRYIPRDNTVDFLKRMSNHIDKAICTVKEDSILYRARIIEFEQHKFEIEEFCKNVLDINTLELELDKVLLSPSTIEVAVINFLPFIGEKENFEQKITDYLKKQHDKKFKGYPQSQCLTPPPNKSSAGRLNPSNISYLYTAEDINTAIYEVKPMLCQRVSVANLCVNRDLKLLDLTKEKYVDIQTNEDGSTLEIPTIIQVIAENFSRPNNNKDLEYIPTQYIAEYIKEVHKLDGVKFKSSLNKNGVNVVLFDESNCTPISSDIYTINNIHISSSKNEYEINDSDVGTCEISSNL